ncbi:MAG: hypothetical protein AAGJ93_06945 [Bacteroidota bacterium]
MSISKYLLSGLFCVCLTVAYGQQRPVFPPCEPTSSSCPDFQDMLDRVYELLDQKEGFKAYDQFQLLESCDDCPKHQEIIQELGRYVLDGVAKIVEEESRQQLDALQEEYDKNKAISRKLRNTNELIEQQLAENERMTRDALATNYMEIAQERYQDAEDINGVDAAHWLTDFTYAYIDSTHQEVQQMMYQLLFQKMNDHLPYTFYESTANELYNIGYNEEKERVIFSMSWSSDSLWLAVGTNLNEVFILSNQGEVVFSFTPETNTEIFSLDWNKNNNKLAVASANTVNIISNTSRDQWNPSGIIIRNDYVRVVRWSPVHSQELALAGDEELLAIYDRDWEEAIYTSPAEHKNWIRALDWSSSGDRLASGDDDGRIVIWEYTDEDELEVLSSKITHVLMFSLWKTCPASSWK